MARIAQWRPLPEDARPRLHLLGLRIRRMPLAFWIALLVVIAFPPALALSLGKHIGMFGGLWGLAFAVLYKNARRRMPPELVARQDDPPPTTQCAVRVTFYQNGLIYGTDIGIASVFDDWLHYDGLRTDFSLCRSDIIHAKTRSEHHQVIYLISQGALIELDLLPYGAATYEPPTKAFVSAFGQWSHSPCDQTGEAMFPPHAIQPEQMAKSMTLLCIWSLILTWAAAVCALSFGMRIGPAGYFIAFLSGCLCLVSAGVGVSQLHQVLAQRALARGKRFRPIRSRCDAEMLVLADMRKREDPACTAPHGFLSD